MTKRTLLALPITIVSLLGQADQSAAPAEIPTGTAITVKTIDSIDSQKTAEGAIFHASLDEPLEAAGSTLAPKGADVFLKLVKTKQSGKISGTTDLTIAIDTVTINGNKVPVATDEVTTSSSNRGKKSALAIGGGAALGAVIGGVLGGGKGAAVGAAAGAAAGTAVQIATKGQKVLIPSETRLTFTVGSANKPQK